jgi:DNA-directed RNA polymerase subunit RPC12/RpoP
VPPRLDFRLEDLRAFHLVRAHCRVCGHKAIVPQAALLRGRPVSTRLLSLARQLRCRRCGARGKAALEMEFQPRD